jgi:Ca-activated chloride channel family protein
MVELSAQVAKCWWGTSLRTIAIIVLATLNTSCTPNWQDLWLTPEQQGERLSADGDYAAAAQRFTDPMRVGAAWYRAGEFERAATAFCQRTSADAHFNRGNSLIMLGLYEQAVAAFDLTLEQRPDWQPGLDNRAIAVARLARLAPPEDDAGGTGGMLEADEIVFDTTGRVNQAQGEETIEDDADLTDIQLRELWLRRVATRPADFLRARFAVQLARQSEVTP